MHECQHLVVVDLVVPLCIGEALQHKAYQVEQPVLLLLRQDSPCGEVRCIALQSEETRLGGEHKCRGSENGKNNQGGNSSINYSASLEGQSNERGPVLRQLATWLLQVQ